MGIFLLDCRGNDFSGKHLSMFQMLELSRNTALNFESHSLSENRICFILRRDTGFRL